MTSRRGGRIGGWWSRLRRRGRGTAILIAAVVSTGLAASTVAPPSADGALPSQLVIEPDLLSKLRTLAGGLHHEIVLCLRGRTVGDTAWASDFYMPVAHLSTSTRSSFERCPKGTLATWHNHPPVPSAVSGVASRGSAPSDATRLCTLSETDALTAEGLGHPFAVVGVDGEVWCWWTLEEVRRKVRSEVDLADPPRGPETLSLSRESD